MNRRRLRRALFAVGPAYRGPLRREGTGEPEGTPTTPPPSTEPEKPADPEDDDDRPMTRREWKAWLASQEKPKEPEKTPEKAPAPPKKDPEPEPEKKEEPEEDVPSAWFRKKKPRD